MAHLNRPSPNYTKNVFTEHASQLNLTTAYHFQLWLQWLPVKGRIDFKAAKIINERSPLFIYTRLLELNEYPAAWSCYNVTLVSEACTICISRTRYTLYAALEFWVLWSLQNGTKYTVYPLKSNFPTVLSNINRIQTLFFLFRIAIVRPQRAGASISCKGLCGAI